MAVDLKHPERDRYEAPGEKAGVDPRSRDCRGEAVDAPDYCRAIEAYLCRKNDGHLIRIVGPSFDRVCSWATRGIPREVAFRGIDRYFDRYYARSGRRRPVRIDFCEADVLDMFDEWRRAVGVWVASAAGKHEPAEDNARRASLPVHLDRVIARLTALRTGADRALDTVLTNTIGELDAVRLRAKTLRGAARAAFLTRLVELDARLLAEAYGHLDPAAIVELRKEAETELAPFRSRLAPEAYHRSLGACVNRLLRERVRLPTLALD